MTDIEDELDRAAAEAVSISSAGREVPPELRRALEQKCEREVDRIITKARAAATNDNQAP